MKRTLQCAIQLNFDVGLCESGRRPLRFFWQQPLPKLFCGFAGQVM